MSECVGLPVPIVDPNTVSVHNGQRAEARAGQLHKGVRAEPELHFAFSVLELIVG